MFYRKTPLDKHATMSQVRQINHYEATVITGLSYEDGKNSRCDEFQRGRNFISPILQFKLQFSHFFAPLFCAYANS